MVVLEELKINNVLEGKSQQSTSSWACQCATNMLFPQGQINVPNDCFLDNNLGQVWRYK